MDDEVTLVFTGDSTYKGSVAVSTISIVKQVTKLTVAKKPLKSQQPKGYSSFKGQ